MDSHVKKVRTTEHLVLHQILGRQRGIPCSPLTRAASVGLAGDLNHLEKVALAVPTAIRGRAGEIGRRSLPPSW
jgi:hypothetical protein